MQWHAEREKPEDDPEKGTILTHPADASQWLALDMEDGFEGFRSIENKIFSTMMNKNKLRSYLRDAKQRAREIRSIYPCRSHSGNIQMNVVGVVVLESPPRDPI
jgi:hypothetical protein